MEQLKCPHCSSRNVSKTLTGNVTNGAKSAGKVAAVVGGKLLENYLGIPLVGKATSAVGKWAISYAPIEFVCNACDSVFMVTFSSDEEIREISLKKRPMPNEIINSVREDYLESVRKERPFLSAGVFTCFTLYCAIYFFGGVYDDKIFQCILSGFFGLPFLIIAIAKWNDIRRLNQEIEMSAAQSPREFKHSHKDLFSQYKQYN